MFGLNALWEGYASLKCELAFHVIFTPGKITMRLFILLLFLLANAHSAGALDSSSSGAIDEQRRILVEEIGKAKSAGVGTTAYEAALSEIENEWKNGAEPAAVNNKILVLRTRIADQIAQQKFLRLSAGKSIMVGGKKDAEVNPAHFATFIAGVEAKMKSVWRPCGRDSGVVRLRFDVSENGNVGNAKVFMTSGIECLDDAAMCALAASQPLDTGPITEAFRKEKVVSIDFAYRYHVN